MRAHRARLELEHGRPTRTGTRHGRQGVQVDTGLGGHEQRLPDDSSVGRRNRVVDQLHHLAVTERAAVDDQLSHRLEQRASALEVSRLASGHDRQGAVERSRR